MTLRVPSELQVCSFSISSSALFVARRSLVKVRSVDSMLLRPKRICCSSSCVECFGGFHIPQLCYRFRS
ncbi:unnamed protein product [Rhodiola kirilowii]